MRLAVYLFFIAVGTVKASDGTSYPILPFNGNYCDLKDVLQAQFISGCEPNISLSNIEMNNEYLYWASNSIRVGNNYRITTNSGADIRMKAGKVIVLKPDTAILRGNHYLARIEPCEPDCIAATDANVPKGISPNGDTFNDKFNLSHLCVANLKILSRYGLTVYEADNYIDEWPGQSEKGDLPTGTYYYVISLKNGEQITGWTYLQQ
jgi:gliding motility-associated-like protein